MLADREQLSFTTAVVTRAQPDALFSALTTLKGLAVWWENPVAGDPSVGGLIRFGFEASEEHTLMRVDESAPDRIRWSVVEDTGYDGEWVGTQIDFSIIESGPTRHLLLRHIGLTPALTSYEACSRGWNHFVSKLVASCEPMA